MGENADAETPMRVYPIPPLHCAHSIVQVLGWDADGTIIFNDMSCSNNWATDNGGCLYSVGKAIFNDGAAVLDNEAFNGGCICKRNAVCVIW